MLLVMADAILRALQRQYLLGNISLRDYIDHLQRYGVDVWDWLPHPVFMDLPFDDQLEIFSRKWPLSAEEHQNLVNRAAMSGTYRRGGWVHWEETHPDAPGVGEVLAEELISLAAIYAGENIPPWTQREELVSEKVNSIWYLIHILQHHGVL